MFVLYNSLNILQRLLDTLWVEVIFHCYYHDCRGVGEVAGYSRKVEGGDRGNEALQRSVAHQIKGLWRVLADRLVVVKFFGEEAVEPEEIDHLCGRIDLSLI